MEYAAWVPARVKKHHENYSILFQKQEARSGRIYAPGTTPMHKHMDLLLGKDSNFESTWNALLKAYLDTGKPEVVPDDLTLFVKRSEASVYMAIIGSFEQARQSFFLKTKLTKSQRMKAVSDIKKSLNTIAENLDNLGIPIKGRDLWMVPNGHYTLLDLYRDFSADFENQNKEANEENASDSEPAYTIGFPAVDAVLWQAIFDDAFKSMIVPTFAHLLRQIELYGSTQRNDQLARRVYASELVNSFKMNFGKDLKTHAAKIISIIFNAPEFDEVRLTEALQSIPDK